MEDKEKFNEDLDLFLPKTNNNYNYSFIYSKKRMSNNFKLKINEASLKTEELKEKFED